MPQSLFTRYQYSDAHYDELFAADGHFRPHWQRFADELHAYPDEQLQSRLNHVARQIFENGVTYNVYADPQGVKRPWELDLLPQIIAHDEWQQIESGIMQRAELMNRILADVYGGQTLLRDGLLPPALVHGHAGFLRPAHGIPCPDNVYLHLYAVDLARSADGRWWAISDRAQAPSGAGYALENRTVISRAFPEQFRDLKVRRLNTFFRTLQQSLRHWAPSSAGEGGTPRIVVLTPGPYNETYFEHAYLARHLGFPLVEGQDLMVSQGCVWLKTLDGLQRVHVILRRQDDDFCDPLEARPDSSLGIPGLMQAAREGQVLIANALGSSLIETGALYGFLPKLCEQVLGQPLLLPSVASWWCGESAALETVLDNLPNLIIKGAFPQLRIKTCTGSDLSSDELARLKQRIRARPYNYVAQESISLSQAPGLSPRPPYQLHNHATCLRVFAVASPDGYRVMPGGLTRISGPNSRQIVTMQQGGGSKDTWVLAPPSSPTLQLNVAPQALPPASHTLSTRTIENLFWLGRYTERCDNIARLLRTTFTLRLDEDEGSEAQHAAVMQLCQHYGLLPDDSEQPLDTLPPQQLNALLLDALFNPEVPHGFAGTLQQLLRIGFNLRERLSLDNWRVLNRLAKELEQHHQAQRWNLAEALAVLDQAIGYMMALSGFALDGMTRDVGWRFLSIGRRLERLQHVSQMLTLVLEEDAIRQADLEWWLELSDSIITYRSRYSQRPELATALPLLVTNQENPRALMFLLKGLVDYLQKLSAQFGPFTDGTLFELPQQIAGLDDHRLAEEGRLPAIVAALREALDTLSDRLSLRFFSHGPHYSIGNEE
ncbi:circularly permuted type 2 ATP-grasp protein [Gibbsiella quercinecans]|uniref:circularly permuted type 2 ATP-grasp protein n=1 Tax=Gibbsiella quercinecans TaxID=929813 RepID=UPI003A4D5D26